MNRAEYRIATQSGGSGLFAKVTLSVSSTDEHFGLKIICETKDGKEWLAAVEFGIRYANEQIFFMRRQFRGLTVIINEILGTTVDTREIAMAYASAMAFWKAIDLYPEKMPSFDKIEKTFTFPE